MPVCSAAVPSLQLPGCTEVLILREPLADLVPLITPDGALAGPRR